MPLRSQPIPADVAATIARSFLSKLTPERAVEVLEGGHRVDVPAGGALAQGAKEPGVGLVLDGLVRMFVTSPAARELTVRYARPGEALGLVHLFGGATAVRCQAVTRARVWSIPAARLRSLAEGDGPLATAIAEECAARASDALEELALLAFGSVRQRVARHLLDLAAARPDTEALVAAVTQRQLADAAGSVREVVARILKELTQAGLTAGADGGILILDAAGLDAEATGRGVKAT